VPDHDLSRREFLKEAGAGAISVGVGVGVLQTPLVAGAISADAPDVDRKKLIAALGDTLIPTAEGYPGYQHLERYGITDEVLKGLQMLSARDLNVFNAAASTVFSGKTFLDLSPEQHTAFLDQVAATFPTGTYNDGDASKPSPASSVAKLDAASIDTLQKVFRFTRNRVMVVFYRNFPEDRIARDKDGLPVLASGDEHQIINPNTKQLVTGWDVAGFPGPLSWEEEEARRTEWMKISWVNE
jgi:hypothetical protein